MRKIHFTRKDIQKANKSFMKLCKTPEYQKYWQELKANPDSGIKFCPKTHCSLLPEECEKKHCNHCDQIKEAIQRVSKT